MCMCFGSFIIFWASATMPHVCRAPRGTLISTFWHGQQCGTQDVLHSVYDCKDSRVDDERKIKYEQMNIQDDAMKLLT